MAEVKWIKITTNIFDDEKIKLIDTMPDRDALIVIWFKILTMAGKTNDNGFLYIIKEMPTTDEMLATIFNRPLNTVRMALDMFKKFGMIEINTHVNIVNWEKHQNIEGLDKIRKQTSDRVAKHRAKRLMLENNTDFIQEKYNKEEKCCYCGSSENLTIDHIIALTKGGNDSLENKVTACKGCNSSKKDKELHVFLNDNLENKLLKLDLVSILSNEKFKNKIEFKKGKFVTLHVTESNATDIELELDIELDKEKNKININQEVFNYYISKTNLTQHTKLVDPMKKGIALAIKTYDLDLDYLKKIIDRHSEKIEQTKNSEYPITPRTITELFGQKKYKSQDLICADYLDEKYIINKKITEQEKREQLNKESEEQYGF